MSLQCPRCGSRFLRDSQPRSFKEKLNRWRFISPLRCLDCQTRFVTGTLRLSDLRWARCPRCQRMDLNGWTGKTYTPPLFMSMKVSFGAHKWRCEYCRINFASFRARKEIFTFSRWKKIQEKNEAQDKSRSAAD